MAMNKEFLDAWFQDILNMQREDQSLIANSVTNRVGSWSRILTRIKTRPFQVIVIPTEQHFLPIPYLIPSEDLRLSFFYSQYAHQFGEHLRQVNSTLFSRAVAFISDFIREPPNSSAKDLVPTIFHWYPDIENPQKSVIFIALAKPGIQYILTMRRYEVEELLQMRETLPFVICNLDSLTQEGDIAGILTYPRQARGDRSFVIKTEELKRLPLIRKMSSQSSADEEERIIFRGHSTRRSQKENLQISTKSNWQLQRSNSSIDDAPAPLPAPSGEQAQKQENFQKFYRAVVSPTHIRVTAGGRIVPNTRAPPQPVFTWNRQKACFEGKKPAVNDNDTVETFQWPQGAAVTDGQSSYSVVHPVMSPASFGQPHGSAPLANLIPQPEFQTTVSINSEEAAQKLFRDRNPTVSNQTTQSSPAIEISPPTRFDLTKPFLYNGQLVYPMPRGFIPPPGTMLPVSMLGNLAPTNTPSVPPGFLPQHALPMYVNALGHPMPMPLQPLLLPPLASSAVIGGYPQLPLNDVANTGSNISGNHIAPATSAAPTNLVPNPVQLQAMRLQMEGLRDYLKTLDHQLANNKYQINEAHVLAQHSYVSQQVADLESRIASAKESNKPQKAGSIKADHIEIGGQKSMSTVIHTRSGPVTVRLPPAEKSTESSSSDDAKKPRNATTISTAENTGTTSETKDLCAKEKTTSSSASSLRSKLTAAACRAPPFKPRSQVPEQSPISPSTKSPDMSVPNSQYGNVGNPWFSNSTQWETNVPINRARSAQSMESSQIQAGESLHATQMHLANFAANPHLGLPYDAYFTTTASPPQQHLHRAPYLVGLPTSSHGLGVKSMGNEYIYPRELTDEELRARHLYWGKAPRELQKGLPKFDGKDFFPPSPSKPRHSRAISHQSNSYEWHGLVPNIHHTGHINVRDMSESTDRQQGAPIAQAGISDLFHKQTTATAGVSNTQPEAARAPNEKDSSDDNDTASLDSWDLPKNDSSFPSFPTDFSSISQEIPQETMIQASPVLPEAVLNSRGANQNRSTDSASKATSSFLQDLLKNPRYNAAGLSSPVRNPLLPAHSTMAAPPSVSSTTAHGLLPHYGGLASASLTVTPPINSPPERQLRHVGALSERLLSDRPPSGLSVPNIAPNVPSASSWQAGTTSSTPVSSSKDAKEYLRALNTTNRNTPAFVDKNLDPNGNGTGPVGPGEDW